MTEEKRFKPTKKQRAWFDERIKNFEKIREKRFALFEGLFIALVVSIIILAVDLIAGEDKFLKLILILFLVFISWDLYKLMLKQTQKPIIALGNMIATRESEPVNIKDKDGRVWSIYKVSDVVHDTSLGVKK